MPSFCPSALFPVRGGSSSLRPQCTRAPRDSSLSPGSPSRSFAESTVAQQTLTPGPCALLGHRFVPDFARPCSPPRPPPLAVSLGLEGHSCLFPEGRRELGRFISAPCHLSQACWELPLRPKATSREWVVSAKKEKFAVLQGVGRWGTERRTQCHFNNGLLIEKETLHFFVFGRI